MLKRCNLIVGVVLLSLVHCTAASAEQYTFKGKWLTTNRKLDGEMTCILNGDSDTSWTGRFFGIWQGVEFDSTGKFEGPPDDFRGDAVIDGAKYQWSGSANGERFKGSFTGERYTGSFELYKAEK